MGIGQKMIESFPLNLTVVQVLQQYTRIAADASDIFYHYTTHLGIEGILRSGGIRATYRKTMNDAGEFDYARKVVYEALDEAGRRHDLPPVVQSLAACIRKNLERLLDDTTEMSSAYCACLTLSPDHSEQWETYAKQGKGFAIGFNMSEFLNMQALAVQRGAPFIFCAPVTYNQRDQSALVQQLLEAGICDLQTFSATCSQQPKHLTLLRDRVIQEIIVHLLSLIDFIKTPIYSSEREMRLVLDPNDGTLKAPHTQHYEHNGELIPFIFMDLRHPKTRRLPLAEIKVGPRAQFLEERAFLKSLLDELGYGRDYRDRPRITQSVLATGLPLNCTVDPKVESFNGAK
jgi:hypothetical protein